MPKLTYTVIRVESMPDWQAVPSEELTHALWGYAAPPATSFQCAYAPHEALYIRMACRESNPLAANTLPDSSVWEDSCMECFFMPEGAPAYVNMEANANGALRCSIGEGRHGRALLKDMGVPMALCRAQARAGEWEVRFTVPQGLLEALYPGFALEGGAAMRANFYKCGDKTAAPHYGCWNHIPLPAPDYHCPEYFGTLILNSG